MPSDTANNTLLLPGPPGLKSMIRYQLAMERGFTHASIVNGPPLNHTAVGTETYCALEPVSDNANPPAIALELAEAPGEPAPPPPPSAQRDDEVRLIMIERSRRIPTYNGCESLYVHSLHENPYIMPA